MSDKNVLIQVKDLKKAFGTNQVLDGITTDICQGEVVAVIGPSGSGKSTFLRSLNLLEVPTGGQILFEGTDITDPDMHWLCQEALHVPEARLLSLKLPPLSSASVLQVPA